MADEGELDDLARRYLALWQDQMTALSADPEFADAQHEALATICDRFDNFDGRGHVCGWMRTVARNTAADQIGAEIRQRRIRDRLNASRVETVHVDAEYDDSPSTEQVAETIVAALPPAYRDVVDAYYLNNKPVEEIADEFFISVDTVYVRLHRARRALREAMRDHCGVENPRECVSCRCVLDGCCAA